MKSIGLFFDKFKNSAVKELKKREYICNIIFNTTKQKINPESINIKNGILIIEGNHSFKSELFLKKKMIIESLKDYKIVDIK